MKTYIHKVQYYETDQMGVVHHSNFIRWFEEARIDLMEQLGLTYAKMEESGYFSPVLSVQCQYKKSVRFGETVEILPKLLEFGNVKFKFTYIIRDCNSKEERAIGETSHCFINQQGKPICLKKQDPEIYKRFCDMLNHELG